MKNDHANPRCTNAPLDRWQANKYLKNENPFTMNLLNAHGEHLQYLRVDAVGSAQDEEERASR